jgi:hypothetical protein
MIPCIELEGTYEECRLKEIDENLARNETTPAERAIPVAVAGQAQILVVPNLEAGNMLAKNLTSSPMPMPPASSWGRERRSS